MESRCSLLDVGLIIELPETFDFSIESLDTLLDNRVPKRLRREWPNIRSSDNAALLSYFGGITGKDEVSSNFLLVLLRVGWVLPGRLESLFDRIIEFMNDEMANIIRFADQPIPWRLTVKLGDVQCSCIAGVAEPINEIGKQ